MYELEEIRHLHLELSSLCNARCPLCPRNFHGFPYNAGYTESNLSLQRLKELLPVVFVQQLTEVLINGNHGDFVMNHESVEICTWLREINPNMKIHISTNGAARNKDFWRSLAKLNLEIGFCIDGLEDTHEVYRQDAAFTRVIENAKTYIDHGGSAVWVFTVFDHNQHQIKTAESLAVGLGFFSFVARSNGRDRGPVYNRDGIKISRLGNVDYGYPDKINSTTVKQLVKIKPVYADQPRTINCEAKQNKSMYVNANGTIAPCCFLKLETHYNIETAIPGFNNISSLYEIAPVFDEIEKTFHQRPLEACGLFCGNKT